MPPYLWDNCNGVVDRNFVTNGRKVLIIYLSWRFSLISITIYEFSPLLLPLSVVALVVGCRSFFPLSVPSSAYMYCILYIQNIYQISATILPYGEEESNDETSGRLHPVSAHHKTEGEFSLFTFTKGSFSPWEWMKEKASAPGRQRRRNFVKFVRWKFVKLSHGLTFPLPVYCLQPCGGKSVPTQPIHTAYFF